MRPWIAGGSINQRPRAGTAAGSALARVVLPSSLARYTGGVTETEVEARDVRGVIRALEARYAGIGRELEEGMAVAVDAEIHQDDLFAAVGPDSEVCFLPRIGGG